MLPNDNKKTIENVALFDMDGTLCDYEKAIIRDYNLLKGPNDPDYNFDLIEKTPYLKERVRIIRRQPNWWLNLEKFKLGFDILDLARELNFKINILTKGPRSAATAWSEKVQWIEKNISNRNDLNITISEDKGIVYGKVLVDDFPEYILRWLEHRKRGLVIMPASNENKNFEHPNVIRYDGTNLEQVKQALITARDRQYKEEVNYRE